jgi:hypothetical protein
MTNPRLRHAPRQATPAMTITTTYRTASGLGIRFKSSSLSEAQAIVARLERIYGQQPITATNDNTEA